MRKRRLEKLLAIPLIAGMLSSGLGFSVNRAYAQDVKAQEQAKQEQKIYSTRDESKRDFAAHGEVDYRNKNLWANRLAPTPPNGYFLPPDYDPYTEKVVFAADIGTSEYGTKSEIFIADFMLYKDESGIQGIADPKTQKRLTWDAEPDIYNVNAFFTKDRLVVYCREYVKKSKKPEDDDYFVMNIKSGKKTKIDYKNFIKLYQEIHKDMKIVVPPSK